MPTTSTTCPRCGRDNVAPDSPHALNGAGCFSSHLVREGRDFVVISPAVARMGTGEVPYTQALRTAAARDLSGGQS